MSTEVLQEARRKYDIATAAWFKYRDLGEIALIDPGLQEESDEIAKGRKYKCTSPAASMAMGVWQRRKAELDAAANNVRRERGDLSCPTCAKDEAGVIPPAREPARGVADRRLPVERDEEAEGLL